MAPEAATSDWLETYRDQTVTHRLVWTLVH
jgi:hypothetical protein